MSQERLMMWNPCNGSAQPYPSHAKQYREYHGKDAWLFNPWTGVRRDSRDIGTDTFGHLIDDAMNDARAARLVAASPSAGSSKPTDSDFALGGPDSNER